MGEFLGIKVRAGEVKIEDVQAWWLPAVKKWLEDNPE